MGSQIGERLKHAREAAGLTQEQAATLLGVVAMTISKRERGVIGISAQEFERVITAYRAKRNVTAHQLSQSVPRDTFVSEQPRTAYGHLDESLMEKARALSRELARTGATDAEIDFFESLIWSRESRRLAGQEGPIVRDTPEFEQLLDDFRAFIQRRIARRQPQLPKPIKPADLPGLVAERHEEVFGATKKRGTKK